MKPNQPHDDTFMGATWSVFMESVSQHLSHRNYSNSNGGLHSKPTIAIAIEGKLTTKEQDELIAWAFDLIDSNYRLWFIKQLKRVGKEAFISAATAAKRYDGVSRQKVFASLLKNS